MSFLTGTNVELIYASTGVGIAKNTFTSEITINDTATMGTQAHLPPDFWLAAKGQAGRGIRIVARGIMGCTTGAPTFTFSVRFGAAANTSSAIVLGTAAATCSASALSNQPFLFEGDVIMESMGAAGTNSTVRGVGFLACPIFAAQSTGAALGQIGVWGGGATPGTVATVDTTITNYINFNVTCGTSNGSNAITLQQLLVFGLN
jgi:hypothetical protein